jgi:putative transposase
MDFMHDSLSTGQPIRVLTILDAYTRECLGLVAQARFTGGDIAAHLGRIATERPVPATVAVDNGTEFTSRALDYWAYWNGVQLDFSRPGKPGDNALIEAFNGRLRQECLSQHWFLSLTDAQHTLDVWRDDYNHYRPHGSLGQQTPVQFPGSGRPSTRTGSARRVAEVVAQDWVAQPVENNDLLGWQCERVLQRGRTGEISGS